MTKSTKSAAKSANKEVIATVAAKSAPEVIQSASAPTKADLARKVFDEAYAQSVVPQRKDIIAAAMQAASLSKPAAATYLQNYKDKKGLSVKKTKVA